MYTKCSRITCIASYIDHIITILFCIANNKLKVKHCSFHFIQYTEWHLFKYVSIFCFGFKFFFLLINFIANHINQFTVEQNRFHSINSIAIAVKIKYVVSLKINIVLIFFSFHFILIVTHQQTWNYLSVWKCIIPSDDRNGAKMC